MTPTGPERPLTPPTCANSPATTLRDTGGTHDGAGTGEVPAPWRCAAAAAWSAEADRVSGVRHLTVTDAPAPSSCSLAF
ncbi:hypothetical protein GCM10009562_32690 [Nocardioides aquaticus]